MSEEGLIFKECLNCNKRFCGRTDKRFCSDYCRTSYNNRVYRSRRVELERIDRELKRNHHILKQLFINKKTSISLKELLSIGYNPKYFTSIPENIKFKRGCTAFECYDFIICIDKKENVEIIKPQ